MILTAFLLKATFKNKTSSKSVNDIPLLVEYNRTNVFNDPRTTRDNDNSLLNLTIRIILCIQSVSMQKDSGIIKG